ncbi:MAG: glycosyltransferase [Thermofilum sp.]|uniref:glycosyltransferase n=1 Tax=Thermofilum sp. TaxID=1961369 RepID=UPI0025885B5A|nr:glycosyltransferase [Thermofilum sp.]MCI4409948.1 glycosyltransferase [Thermofilum sp.]
MRVAGALSYSVVAQQICKVNGWDCKLSRDSLEFDIFIGSQYDVAFHRFWIRPRKFIYMTVEGEFIYESGWKKVKEMCDMVRCYVPTKWGKELVEGHGVKVQDVIPHALPEPIPDPPNTRAVSVVYLNARYELSCQLFALNTCQECERKGWRWWPKIKEVFPDALGFVSGCTQSDKAISFINATTEDVYRLLALGKVYANLSTHEGFGINPIMALAMGTPVVSWDIPVFRETIPESVFVPVNVERKCYVDPRYLLEPGFFIFRWGRIEDFIESIKRAMNMSVDYASVRQRYNAQKLYTKFL